MTDKFRNFVFHAAVFQIILHICVSNPLEMTVYYESLCPYSQDFFIKQLQPNLEKFNNHVNWVLIPYGNAKTERDSNGSIKSITCQHKEPECLGNAIMACALKKISDSFTQLRFCVCFMVNKGDCAAFQKCALTYGIDYNAINTCTSNGEGMNFLAAYGDIHSKAQPPITGVPTLALNGKQLTEDENNKLFENACKFLCDHLGPQKPDACNSCPAPTTSTPVSVTKAK